MCITMSSTCVCVCVYGGGWEVGVWTLLILN